MGSFPDDQYKSPGGTTTLISSQVTESPATPGPFTAATHPSFLSDRDGL